MTVFMCMPDELKWNLDAPTPTRPRDVLEVIAHQQARELARLSAKPEPEKEPELSLYAWRRPGTRHVPKGPQRYRMFSET